MINIVFANNSIKIMIQLLKIEIFYYRIVFGIFPTQLVHQPKWRRILVTPLIKISFVIYFRAKVFNAHSFFRFLYLP